MRGGGQQRHVYDKVLAHCSRCHCCTVLARIHKKAPMTAAPSRRNQSWLTSSFHCKRTSTPSYKARVLFNGTKYSEIESHNFVHLSAVQSDLVEKHNHVSNKIVDKHTVVNYIFSIQAGRVD